MRYQGENNSFKIPLVICPCKSWFGKVRLGRVCLFWKPLAPTFSCPPPSQRLQAMSYCQGAAHFGFSEEKKLGFCHKLAFIGPRLDLVVNRSLNQLVSICFANQVELCTRFVKVFTTLCQIHFMYLSICKMNFSPSAKSNSAAV